MLTLPGPLLAETFQMLRLCGASRNECVGYWVASLDAPDIVARVVHPTHTASDGGYQVDGDWVTSFFVELRAKQETVRAQIHTHPHAAGHSWIDDGFSLVPAPGFLSLVIPDFAAGPVGFDGAHLVEMTDAGDWSELDPQQVFSHV